LARGGRTLIPIVVGVALLGFAPAASPSEFLPVRNLGTQEQSLLGAINQVRAANGVAPLRIGPRLQRAAESHSQAMVRTGSFAHGDWYRRLRRNGVRARTLGETIAWGVGTDGTAQGIVASWLASPPHRATMLAPGFRRVGVGVAVGSMGGFTAANVATADFAG